MAARPRARSAAREAATPASPRSARHPPPLVWDDCPPFPWDAATAEKFLATYWQKAPCLLRGAGDCAALEALLTPYERPGAETGSRESRSYDVGALAADAAAAVGGEAAHRARCVALGGAAVIGRTRTQFEGRDTILGLLHSTLQWTRNNASSPVMPRMPRNKHQLCMYRRCKASKLRHAMATWSSTACNV